jgi:hypothetical protein
MLLLRRLLIPLVVLAGLLVVADRVALHYAERDVAKRLQADAHTSTTPGVSIHGFPFLTQLIGGKFGSVDIDMHGIDTGTVRISRLTVHLHDAHVSLGDVLGQTSSQVRVDRATAQLFLTYQSLPAHLDHSLIRGVSVSGDDTLVIRTPAGSVPLRLAGLPFGIRLTGAKATNAGIVVDGEANGLTVQG